MARHRRIVVVICILIVATAGTAVRVASTLRDDDEAGRDDNKQKVERPFSDSSAWNTSVRNATVAAQSSAYVDELRSQIQHHGGAVGINTSQYTPPVYIVDAAQPTVTVTWNNCQHKPGDEPGLKEQLKAVPLPAEAKPSAGTDKELVVWQRDTDTLWDLWGVDKTPDGTWSACWGGRLQNVSTGNGVFPSPYGTSASGLALLGGLIRPEELHNGKIDHALAVALVDIKKGSFVSPAVRTDGQSTDANAIPEGQRFRLAPDVNVNALHLTDAGKTIAHALQDYGMIVRDRSGSVTLYAENEITADKGAGKPYVSVFNGQQTWEVMEGFPWDRMQAVDPPK